MKYGFFSTDKINSRSQLVKNIMCKDGPSDEERQTLKFYYNVEKYTNYGSRISILPILYLLYKKRFFDKKSPFFIREIGAVIAGITYIGAMDYAANELMWKNCHPIVKKYNTIMESYYIDDETQMKMKEKYRAMQKQKLYD
jgi:hypothetical protein